MIPILRWRQRRTSATSAAQLLRRYTPDAAEHREAAQLGRGRVRRAGGSRPWPTRSSTSGRCPGGSRGASATSCGCWGRRWPTPTARI